MSLFEATANPSHSDRRFHDIVDVSGAGDTVELYSAWVSPERRPVAGRALGERRAGQSSCIEVPLA